MTGLAESAARTDALKREHYTAEQRQASGRPMTPEDLGTMGRLLVGTDVEAEEVAGYGLLVVQTVMRDLRRKGMLRGARQADLRAVVFAAFFEGLLLGLHHRGAGS